MAGWNFITGLCTASWTAQGGTAIDIGDSETGWEIVESPLTEDIFASLGGRSPVDGVATGSIVMARANMVEFAKLVNTGFPSSGAGVSPLYGVMNQGSPVSNVGKLLSSLAGKLILTPVPGTALATAAGSKVLNIYTAINLSNVEQLLSYHIMKGPLVFRCLPSAANSNLAYQWA